VIIVFGSINVDLVARVQRLPQAGETLAGRSFAMRPGGKGANQALAARRAGGDVTLFGCVGRDEAMHSIALRALVRDGIDLTGIHKVDAATGVALVHVDDRGQNSITVIAGANGHACASQVPAAMLSADTTVLMQLEVPLQEVAALARHARKRGARVILNAAPAASLPATLLDDVDVLVVNELEAQRLAGSADVDVHAACHRLAAPARTVVATLGPAGALCVHRGATCTQPAPAIDVVDTVGAGDAFTAALAVALDRGDGFASAIGQAVAAGTLACGVAGAQDSMPTREAIERLAASLAGDSASRGHPDGSARAC
jgi:ribokinase